MHSFQLPITQKSWQIVCTRKLVYYEKHCDLKYRSDWSTEKSKGTEKYKGHGFGTDNKDSCNISAIDPLKEEQKDLGCYRNAK